MLGKDDSNCCCTTVNDVPDRVAEDMKAVSWYRRTAPLQGRSVDTNRPRWDDEQTRPIGRSRATGRVAAKSYPRLI
jgi:hypothetical protein